MKKKFGLISCLAATLLSCSFVLGACGGGSDSAGKKDSYTIQYTDDAGVHTLEVEEGAVYSLESIPYRYGYEFTGLYSLEKGGTQYVNSSGASVTPFQDGMNVVLFPQFAAKTYQLILDYQGATVTGSRSIEVSYDSTLSNLPTDLTAEYKTFTGWYTLPESKGTQIADRYGVLPTKNKINEKNFNLDDADGNIYLYAGFKGIEYDVTLNFGNGQTEEIKVEHGTNVSEMIYDTRVDGNGVVVWSRTENDTDKSDAVTGKITGATTLYAAEFAPVLELDENGGDEIASVVARAGSTITLPTPVRENYQFVEWQDVSGNTYNSSVMPETSVQLKAVWQAKLVFDENGGTEVDDISAQAGSSLILPVPEREGYIFAGWYTADKTKYESTSMPATSAKLKAGWYRAKKETIVKISSSGKGYSKMTQAGTSNVYNGLTAGTCEDDYMSGLTFNFADEYGLKDVNVTIEFHFLAHRVDKSSSVVRDKMHFEFYSDKVVSSSAFLDDYIIDIDNGDFRSYTFTLTLPVKNMIFMTWYCNLGANGYSNNATLRDLYYTISYPDTANLYL
ncbi:MAG: InlB B-repeat-containing protein [Clostridia bacterium]|nr:InlB B-repeat-containing protein [Clostridia bacterium]